MTERLYFDGVLIVGAGLAGLSAAMAAAPRKALVLTSPSLLKASSSAWAQGGIAAPFMPGDSPELHASDTVAGGSRPAPAASIRRWPS
jgi:L-aspartate oxidase